MPAILLDGRAAARAVQQELASRVAVLRRRGVTPAVGIILIGDDAASVRYVRNKIRAAKDLGIAARVQRLVAKSHAADAQKIISAWNADPALHGLILQLPLPAHLSAFELTSLVQPEKDVDCLHPENLGRLALGTPRFLPPTPAGIQKLLTYNGIPIEGAHVVIVGRGQLVGKPLALVLLLQGKGGNATVTVCHRATKNLAALTRTADILVVAANAPRCITGDDVRPGAAVVDTGTHPMRDGWVGDVDHESVSAKAAYLTPVPGGVGPMTVSLLLQNVVRAAERAHGLAS